MPKIYSDNKDRITRNVVVTDDGCWHWQKAVFRDSRPPQSRYGLITAVIGNRRRAALAHRVSYEAFVGPIPPGMCVLHKCDNPPCCNPSHLFLGTPADNTKDCIKKNRRHSTAGEFNGNSKLSTSDVLTIRRMYWVFKIPQKRIAADFGLYISRVNLIVRGLAWSHALKD
jgi:hypothetical protein